MKKHRSPRLEKLRDHRRRGSRQSSLKREFVREGKFMYYAIATKTASHIRQTPVETDWQLDLYQDVLTEQSVKFLYLSNKLVPFID